MMTTKDAIKCRRSIRKYKNKTVPESALTELLEAARLAPSGKNCQPWCFKIVTDKETIKLLSIAADEQSFITKAPVVMVCCADIKRFMKFISDNSRNRMEYYKNQTRDEIGSRLAIQVAIAVEHMVLRALDFELGTCWIRSLNEEKVREIFGWDENIFVVALLVIGYPDENPGPGPRLKLNEILL
jgi:nitroreductase